MDAATSTSLSSSTPSTTTSANPACATQTYSAFPTNDTACAIGSPQGFPSTYRDALKKCCKSAPVESWAADCALYCLAVDQPVSKLQECWQEEGVRPGDIYCSGNNSATATGKPSSTTGSSASGGASASAGANGGDGGSNGAAVGRGVSKAGVAVLGVVFGSAFLGALL